MVPNDEERVVFQSYHYPKEVINGADDFLTVARIPDALLKRVDPTNSVLVAYLQTIDSSVLTGILLPREEKKSKRSNKSEHASSEKQTKDSKSSKSPKKKLVSVEESAVHEVSMIETQTIEPVAPESQQKVVIPSKTGMFRRIKKMPSNLHKSLTTNVI